MLLWKGDLDLFAVKRNLAELKSQWQPVVDHGLGRENTRRNFSVTVLDPQERKQSLFKSGGL